MIQRKGKLGTFVRRGSSQQDNIQNQFHGFPYHISTYINWMKNRIGLNISCGKTGTGVGETIETTSNKYHFYPFLGE